MTTSAGLIIILGSPNADDGALPAMALGRVALGYARHCELGWPLLLTGGFGEHFNRTTLPHAHYLQDWLLARGVATTAILPFVLSRHTGEDAQLARPIVEATGARQLLVVTSDFHVARATWHFRAVFPDYAVEVIGAPYLASCTVEDRERLVAHERRRLAELAGRASS
jgi:uncharacterized SAM-binding protein YcdF (DUF218 family)